MDLSKTIEELENDYWGPPKFESNLVLSCHRLRKVPLSDLSSENLRMLIGQEIGLHYLLPIALDKLVQNPLESGDMYDGDLLNAVASVSDDFWNQNPELNDRVVDLKSTLDQIMETLSDIMPQLNKRKYS